LSSGGSVGVGREIVQLGSAIVRTLWHCVLLDDLMPLSHGRDAPCRFLLVEQISPSSGRCTKLLRFLSFGPQE
jgi:hypothetical protein